MAILDSDDRLLQRIRALPPQAPDASLDAIVVQAGLDALIDATAGRRQAPGELGWFGRLVVPAFLSVTTIGYLWWAVSAASSLYL